MGYFSNGTEGIIYQEQYCSRCLHNNDKQACPVIFLHFLYNYDECNNPNSFLNELIPRSADKLDNEQCRMFIAKGK